MRTVVKTPGKYGSGPAKVPAYPAKVPAKETKVPSYGTQNDQVGYQQPYFSQGGPDYQVNPQPVSYDTNPICY